LLASQYGNVPLYRKELANSLNGLGAVLSQLGQSENAERAWLDAVQELKVLVSRAPQVADYRGLLAQTNRNLAYLHRDDSDTTRLEGYLRNAVDQQRTAVSLSPTNVFYVRSLRSYESALARLLVTRGRHADAADTAEQLAARSADDPSMLYAAARVLAQCALVAEQDTDLDATRRSEIASGYRAKASELIGICRQQSMPIKAEDFPGMELPKK
jgi:hypothetical protein